MVSSGAQDELLGCVRAICEPARSQSIFYGHRPACVRLCARLQREMTIRDHGGGMCMSVSCTLQLNTTHGRLRDIAEMCMLCISVGFWLLPAFSLFCAVLSASG